MTLGITLRGLVVFNEFHGLEKETGLPEDPRFKFTTEPRHFTFMGRPHVAHYPKCATKIFKICSTPMSQLVSKMVKNGTAGKIE